MCSWALRTSIVLEKNSLKFGCIFANVSGVTLSHGVGFRFEPE